MQRFFAPATPRSRRVFAWASAACLLALFASRAQGQRTFDFVTDNNNGNYVVLPNGTAVVNLFFRETLANGATPSLLVQENGLYSSVARVTRTTSPSARR